MISRRLLLSGAALTALGACARPAPPPALALAADPAPLTVPSMPARYGAITDEPFPVPAVPDGIVPPHLWRQVVANPYPDLAEGDILVDPDETYLYLVEPGGRALRYGVGVGGAGFAWAGDARLQFKRDWPRWKVPEEMIARRPELAPYSVANGGMDPGPGNPLGARALYLFQDGVDTLYRIHGACEPENVGKAVSAGCIRMLDQDVIDLAERARDGVTVRVLPSLKPGRIGSVY